MNQKDNNANVSGISTTADNSQTVKQYYESYEDIVSREMQPMKYQKCDNGIDMDEFWYSRSTAHAYQSGAQTAVQQPQYQQPQTDAHAEKPHVKQAQKAEKTHRQNIRTEQKTAKKPAPEKPASATETPKHKKTTTWAEHQPSATAAKTKAKPVQPSQQIPKPNTTERKAAAANSRTQKHVFYKECRVAGAYYHILPELWEFYEVGDEVVLVRDRGNVHDENAVAVALREDYEDPGFTMDEIMGFIPKSENADIAKFLDTFGTKALYCKINRVTGTDASNGNIYISIFYVV